MKLIKLVVRFFIDLFGIVDRKSIWIDGGFGSQIIGYMQYLDKSSSDPSVKCNVSFFLRPKSDPEFSENITYRNWQLDYFGIELSAIPNQNTKFGFRPNLKEQGIISEKFLKKFEKAEAWRNAFPLKEETFRVIQKKYNIGEQKYTAIHIRKGDFLKFSSLLIDDAQIFSFLHSINNIINDRVFFISDDSFDQNYTNKIYEIFDRDRVKFVEGGNEFEIHALLRESDILITSNSMFSLSAALLQKEDGVSILPKYFFGSKFKEHNRAVGALSSWVVLSK